MPVNTIKVSLGAFRISRLARRNGDDYPDAATKHIEDATALWKANRLDGTGYHAGYVVECSLKTLVQYERQNPRGYKHDLSRLSAEALRLATLPRSRTARYMPPSVKYGPIQAAWDSEMRYWAAGRMSRADAIEWLRGAWWTYNATVGLMKKDGVI